MTTYISILRGINVSGHNLIKMDALKVMYESLGFSNIATYVQSGNAIFRAKEADLDLLARKISDQIKTDFGFDVPVIVMTIDKLKRVIDNNPFSKEPDKTNTFLHVTFLSSVPKNSDFTAIEEKKQDKEEIIISKDVVYLYCPHGYGRTKLTNNFLESKLKVGATTRNWKTTTELLKIASQIETL